MRRILLTVFLLAVLCMSAHTASAAPIVSIEPSHPNVLQGDMFTVNITADPQGVETMGAQYYLHFNNVLLNATEQTKGDFLSHDGASTNTFANKINNTIGVIEYGETRIGVTYGVTTPGILSSVTFRAMEPGVCNLALIDVVLSDPDAKEIPDVSINAGTCTIRSTGTGTPTATHTATPTATDPLPTVATPTPTDTPTATVVETAVAAQTSPTEPQSTAIPSATLKQTMKRPSDNTISGFTSILAMMGLLIALYAISKGKR